MYSDERIALEAKLQEIYDRNNITIAIRTGGNISIEALADVFADSSLSV